MAMEDRARTSPAQTVATQAGRPVPGWKCPRGTLGIVIVACGGLAAPLAGAAEFPSKPIRLIVPFPPGGTTDILARLLAPKLTESLKQPIVIDNRAGASGMIGGDAIAKAPSDGHTIGIIISLHAMSPAMFAKTPFDPQKDFAPITQAISVANVISVHPSLPAKSIPQLVALAKANPGKLSFGSAGVGTGVHLTGELFKSVAKIDIVHVPYKGGGPSLADLIAGQVPMGVQNVSTVVQYVRSGRIRALGVSSLERSSALPDVPTVASQGFPGFEAKEWYGFVGPGATPQAVVARLNHDLVSALHQPDVRARLQDLGTEIVADAPEQFGALIKSELAKWATLIKSTGIHLE
jgi:tripartite-type tricarboxylate transporter receptor subunit TctC